MVKLGLNISYDEAKNKVLENLENGKALDKFLEFISYQNGDINNLTVSKYTYEVKSESEGYISNIDALSLGKLSMSLGAGRENLEDKLDYGAGIILNKTVGDKISKGDILMTLYTNKLLDISLINADAFTITKKKSTTPELIYKVL